MFFAKPLQRSNLCASHRQRRWLTHGELREVRPGPTPGCAGVRPDSVGPISQALSGHSDVAVEFRVTSPIHLPHAAFADLGGDLIRTKRGAWAEGHGYVTGDISATTLRTLRRLLDPLPHVIGVHDRGPD